MQAVGDRAFPVTILTHEGGGPPPHEQTLSQLLTDFFTSAGVGVHTMVFAGDLENSQDKRKGPHAHLTLVDVQPQRYCAALSFHCPQNEVDKRKMTGAVFTWPSHSEVHKVSLHQIVRRCKLAIVLACSGDQVIEDYLKATRFEHEQFPDMLVCNAPEMSSATTEILSALLLNIVDSDLAMQPRVAGVAQPREAGEVYRAVRAAIVRIFQIVKLFDADHDGFWRFLKQVGCINDLTLLKQQQQLGYPRRLDDDGHSRFRIPVSVNTYRDDNLIGDKVHNIPQHVLEQFRALQLVCKRRPEELVGQKRKPGDDMIYRENWLSVDPLVPADGADKSIDRFLREYVHPPPAAEDVFAPPPAAEVVFAPPPPDQDAHMPRLNLLLARLLLATPPHSPARHTPHIFQ